MIYKIETVRKTYVEANSEEEAMEKYEEEDFITHDEEVKSVRQSSMREAFS